MNHPQEIYGLEEFMGKGSRSNLKMKHIAFYKAGTEWEDEEVIDGEECTKYQKYIEQCQSKELN